VRYAIPAIRVFLGVVFVVYGLVKLGGGQFHHGDFVIDSRDLGRGAEFFVWAFFGYSRPYAWFIGLGELIPGLLLLLPRTAHLGALTLFPVTLNITVMTFGFGFPGVKYASLIYTLLTLVLLWHDRVRLKRLLWEEPGPALAPLGGAARAILIGLGVLILFPLANAMVASLSPGPEPAAIEATVRAGWPRDRVTLKRSSYYGPLGFLRKGYVDLEVSRGDSTALIRMPVYRPTSFGGWRLGEPGPAPPAGVSPTRRS
jgi:uncharacterized membrane protein YphA (DoxX/SURF4 family)